MAFVFVCDADRFRCKNQLLDVRDAAAVADLSFLSLLVYDDDFYYRNKIIIHGNNLLLKKLLDNELLLQGSITNIEVINE